MSFYKWSNVNQQSSLGWTAGDLFTDDPAFFHVSNIVGKTLYINNMPVGNILSTDLKPAGTGTYTLQRWESFGVLDAADPDIITTALEFIGITAISGWFYNTPITSIELRNNYYYLGRPAVQIGDVVAERMVTLYTDDPAVISATTDSLIGQEIYADGVLLGIVNSNSIFDTNSPNVNQLLSYNTAGGQVGETVDATGKVLMQVGIQLDVAIGNYNMPTSIYKVTVGPIAVGDWLYTTSSNIDGFVYKQGEYGALYHQGQLSSDALTLVADNNFLWDPIKGGNLGLHLNGTFVAPIIDLRTGLGYVDMATPGQNLPAANVKNPWPLTQRIGFYMTSLLSNPAEFRAPITTVEFKPYYNTSSANGKYYVSVTAAPDGSSESTMPALVNACVPAQILFIDGVSVGTITAWGVKDLAINAGKTPINFAGFTGSHASASFKEFFFEVAAPTRMPITNQDIRVTVNSSGASGDGELINGCVVLNGVPNIKEGENGLVGKRLIINEIYVGLVIANTLDSITTGLTAAHDLIDIPLSIAGIWRLETVDNIGRIPLCIAHVMSVSDYPSYPSMSIVGKGYDIDYAYDPADFNYYPNGTLVYTRRDTYDINSTPGVRVIGHDLPAWVEHAELSPETLTYRLNNTPDIATELPVVAKYATLMGSMDSTLSKMWMSGYVKLISYDAVKNNSFAQIVTNIPGELANPTSTPTFVGGFRLVPAVTTIINYGEYDSSLNYETGALVEFAGNVHVKLAGSTDGDIGTWQLVNISVDPLNTTPNTLIILPTGTMYIDNGGIPYEVTVIDTIEHLNRNILCASQFVYWATAPHPVEMAGIVVECTTPNISEDTGTVLRIIGFDAELADCTVVEYISSMAVLTSSAPAIMTPLVTSSVVVQGSAAPVKVGTTIQLKRGNRVNLPTSAAVGEPLVTLDTGELFIGTGTSLRKISDVIVSDTEPAAEDRSKLWYNPIANETRIYKDDSWQVTGAEASMDYGTF